jgi:hypothetical protein
MWKRVALCLGTMVLVVGIASAPISGYAGILDHIPVHSDPPTLTQVACMIDHIQNSILNQGTVVVKQPDIWSQARMTKFRKEFEDTMQPEVNNFKDYLSAQIARSDAASFSSQTALAATLTPFPAGTTIQNTATLAATTKADGTTPLPFPAPASTAPATTATQDFTLLNTIATGSSSAKAAAGTIPLSVEPNVRLDETSDYITHLHRLRRINLGDDTADSAGYGLYLMRVPVSITPGDKTVKGYGAIINMTVRHDFGPRFLPATYRNLVINDLVEQLSPVVHALIRSGIAHNVIFAGSEPASARSSPDSSGLVDSWMAKAQPKQTWALKAAIAGKSRQRPVSSFGPHDFGIAPSDLSRVMLLRNLLRLAIETELALDLDNLDPNAKPSPDDPKKVRMTDVRSYLRRELESAYDLMEGGCKSQAPVLQDSAFIDALTDQVYCRVFEGPHDTPVGLDPDQEPNLFHSLYKDFTTTRLPGNLHDRAIGVLCWGIAIEAGMLNRHLHEDMRQTKGPDGWACPPEVEGMSFYLPEAPPEVEQVFESYVKARWPMITFALEPVTDQQNIEDAFTRRRDLQLAIAFALSSGQINFRQAIQYTRTLQYEAQTIALNQTVSAFAHGNDTFGWRITPRYQTPPEESNLRAVTNLLLRGGPGPNYVLKNSKIEPGLRELTAVVVMPSFVRGMRLDVATNWFRLHDPDDFKLHTNRTVELGRRINEARNCLASADTCGLYRHEDVERLQVRLHQLEAMLPLQTEHVQVPYENTLGGFALFTQGATCLVPELSGFEGIEYIDPNQSCDIIVYGKHFSIYESAVVVGGVTLPREGTSAFVTTDANVKQVVGNSWLTPLRNPDGTLILVTPTGTTVPIKDTGSYDILSREVLRVRIPAGVKTATRGDGSEVVEVYVATSTGISNRLQIPVAPRAATAPAGDTSPGYVLAPDSLTIPVTTHFDGTKVNYDLLPVPFTPNPIRVQPISPVFPIPPLITVTMSIDTTAPKDVGTMKLSIPDVEWDGSAYTIKAPQLFKFATDILTLMNSNKVLAVPPPLPPVSPFLTSKSIAIDTVPPSTQSTTVNQLKINLQVTLTPGKSSALSPAPSAAALAAMAPPGAKGPGGSPAAPSAVAQRTAQTSIPLPNTTGRTRDPQTRPAGLEATVPAALDLVGQATPQPLSPQFEALPAQFQSLSDRTAALSAQLSTVLARPAVPPQTILMMPPQTAPVVNVAVPVTNVPRTPKHHGLFHRQPATPQNPARRPMLSRIMNP